MSEEAQSSVRLPSLGIFYDNKFHDSVSGKKFPTLNPHNEKVICELQEGDKADVENAVAAARKAFDEGPWPRMSGRERGNYLFKLASLMEANIDNLGTLESLDNGKPAAISKAVDVKFCIDWVRYYAGWADKITGKTLKVGGPFASQTLSEPIGVVGAIIPWNFPLLMLTWKFAPALACGCTIVVKTAEQTPLSAQRLAELVVEAGIPEGVFNIVPGYGPTAGAGLATHPGIDKIAFTGSTEIGHKIMEYTANGTLKPITLELGGKSPIIVCEDVDIDHVVEETHQALFFNMGQCCCAGSRLYVHEKIYDEFVEKATARAKQRKVGDPFTEVEQGPQVDTEQFNKILGYIEKGKSQGARLMCGGNRFGDCGYYIEPTVFADVKEDMDIAKDEIFGPVQSIFKFSDYDEVVKAANNTTYGLAAGVYSKDVDKCNFLARSIKAGSIWVNCYNIFDPNIPFGGYKESGIGRENGEYVLKNFLQTKCVTMPLKNSPYL